MAAVLVTISYKIKTGNANEYIAAARDFVAKVNAAQPSVNVTLYVDDDEANHFTEVYECPDAGSYDTLEDSYTDEIRSLVSKVAGCVDGRQAVKVLTKRA